MKTTTPIFNFGPDKQLSMRADGVWFERTKRDGKPGWRKWRLSEHVKRPAGCWFDGQFAELPEL